MLASVGENVRFFDFAQATSSGVAGSEPGVCRMSVTPTLTSCCMSATVLMCARSGILCFAASLAPRPKRLTRELVRVVRPGGTAVVHQALVQHEVLHRELHHAGQRELARSLDFLLRQRREFVADAQLDVGIVDAGDGHPVEIGGGDQALEVRARGTDYLPSIVPGRESPGRHRVAGSGAPHVAERVQTEGLAVETARAVSPGHAEWEYFGYARRQYARVRELEGVLSRVTQGDLAEYNAFVLGALIPSIQGQINDIRALGIPEGDEERDDAGEQDQEEVPEPHPAGVELGHALGVHELGSDTEPGEEGAGQAGALQVRAVRDDNRRFPAAAKLRFLNGATQFAAVDIYLVPPGLTIASALPASVSRRAELPA